MALQKVQDSLKKIWKLKLEATEAANGEAGLPRVVKLARRLKLSEKETTVLIYTLCSQVLRVGVVITDDRYQNHLMLLI